MLLEETIHAFWRDTTPLSDVVPPERFLTGPATIDVSPRVVLVSEQTKTLFHTNKPGPWRKTIIRFEIHHESYETGAALARLVEEIFDRLLLNGPDGDWSFRFRSVEGGVTNENETGWIFLRRFELTGQ